MGKIYLTEERKQLLCEIEKRIGYSFNDIGLLDRALTHSSYRLRSDHVTAYKMINESMEFLGDSVLDFVISEHLYRLYPDWNEGKLSKQRAMIVCEQSLVLVAREICLWRYILVGKGESDGEAMNPSIMADAVEAVLAGVYIDGGMDAAKNVIMRLLEKNINDIIEKRILRDYKTDLQELVQHIHAAAVVYRLVGKEGPQHDAIFTVEAQWNGETVGTGTGKNKKEAEQNAAKQGIEQVKNLLQRRNIQ